MLEFMIAILAGSFLVLYREIRRPSTGIETEHGFFEVEETPPKLPPLVVSSDMIESGPRHS